MMRRPVVLLAFAIAFVATTAAGSGTTVPLTAATSGRTDEGIMLLRPPPTGRVRLVGTFVMGSDPLAYLRGKGLCEREPLGAIPRQFMTAGGMVSETYCERANLEREMPAHTVTLSPYYIDRTEVTVEAYDRCVRAGVCDPPDFTRGDPHFDKPNFPITHVSREDGETFCAWAHGRLPTEAEWELAARGIGQRTFPWGELYNSRLANHGSLALDDQDASDGFLGLAPVGSYPDGVTPEGVLDLAGNVAEWVADLLQITPVAPKPGAQPELKIEPYLPSAQTNPVSTSGGVRIARGGSFESGAHMLRGAARWFLAIPVKLPSIGFRCVQDG